jgi:hypothetical protein
MLKKLKRLVMLLIMFFPVTNVTAIEEEYFKRSPFVKPDDIAIEKEADRARQTVKMLDDLYKTFIVLITVEYVDSPSILPAATLSKRVFEAMGKKGWHKARLLDATDNPFNPDSNPKDKFERDAIKAIVSGRSYFERSEKIEGKDYLRAATSVRAVTEGCTFCHPDKKVGELLGAISYSIPLDGYFNK